MPLQHLRRGKPPPKGVADSTEVEFSQNRMREAGVKKCSVAVSSLAHRSLRSLRPLNHPTEVML